MKLNTKVKLLLILMMNITYTYGQINNQKPITSGGGFEYEDCGCEFNVNLKIFNGQRGVEISEEDEWEKGAITVANKNINLQEGDIDFMKLVIEAKGKKTGTCNVELFSNSNISFWNDEAGTSEVISFVFSSDDLPITLWVEAKDISMTLKDIEIKAFVGGKLNDSVRATGIWCKFVDKYNVGSSPNPYDVCNQSLADLIYDLRDNQGNLYGLGYFNNSIGNKPSYGGRILVQFELLPLGAQDIWPIYFDVTRRKQTNTENIISGDGNFVLTDNSTFPLESDLPNDDVANEDEDNTPSALFGFDGPNIELDPDLKVGDNSFSYVKYNANFEEYVRMSFDPNEPFDNLPYGSRCSDKVPWIHNRCVKIWSIDSNDPYSPINQIYQVIEESVTHSMPTRILGLGNGEIKIVIENNATTEGYTIEFDDNEIAHLYNSANLVSSSNKNNGSWSLNDTGKISIIIKDNPQNKYFAMDRILFSVLADSYIFNNVKIE